ncbi:5-hydroxytryptamine receptor 1F-like isoform X2 [Apostichopus japonicus]
MQGEHFPNMTSIVNISHTEDDTELYKFAAVPLVALILWTFIGNSFVLIAVYREKNLKSMANYVIASLATADLLLAIIVMPLSLYYLIRQKWGLGLFLCVAHLSLDVMLCTASIIHLCAIAVNRYLAVTFPLLYSRERVNSRSRILGTIIPVWAVAIAVSLPLAVQGIIHPEYNLTDDGSQCGFFDRTFIVYSSMCSFYVPLTVMIIVDFRAVRKLHKRKSHLEMTNSVSRTNGIQASSEGVGEDESPSKVRTKSGMLAMKITFRTDHSYGGRSGYGSTTVEAVKPSKQTRRNFHSNKRERRAAKTLVVVFVCFIVLWLPFFVMHLINGFCPNCNIPDNVFFVLTWLGYASSAVNPCIYTCFNRDFRRAFVTIVLCRSNLHRKKSVRFTETSTVSPFRASFKHRV